MQTYTQIKIKLINRILLLITPFLVTYSLNAQEYLFKQGDEGPAGGYLFTNENGRTAHSGELSYIFNGKYIVGLGFTKTTTSVDQEETDIQILSGAFGILVQGVNTKDFRLSAIPSISYGRVNFLSPVSGEISTALLALGLDLFHNFDLTHQIVFTPEVTFSLTYSMNRRETNSTRRTIKNEFAYGGGLNLALKTAQNIWPTVSIGIIRIKNITVLNAGFGVAICL